MPGPLQHCIQHTLFLKQAYRFDGILPMVVPIGGNRPSLGGLRQVRVVYDSAQVLEGDVMLIRCSFPFIGGGWVSCLFQLTDKCVHGGILITVTTGYFPVNEA